MLDQLEPAGIRGFIIDLSFMRNVASYYPELWAMDVESMVPILLGENWQGHLYMYGFQKRISRENPELRALDVVYGRMSEWVSENVACVEELRDLVIPHYEHIMKCSLRGSDVTVEKYLANDHALVRTSPWTPTPPSPYHL